METTHANLQSDWLVPSNRMDFGTLNTFSNGRQGKFWTVSELFAKFVYWPQNYYWKFMPAWVHRSYQQLQLFPRTHQLVYLCVGHNNLGMGLELLY